MKYKNGIEANENDHVICCQPIIGAVDGDEVLSGVIHSLNANASYIEFDAYLTYPVVGGFKTKPINVRNCFLAENAYDYINSKWKGIN